jgi:hypothetical protein
MVRPLSEQFADLSARLKEAEDSVEAAAHKEKEKVESRLSKLHSDASSHGDRIKQDVSSAEADVASKWHELQNKVRSDIDNIKQDVDERREEHDAKRAEKKAEKAENHAAAAIAFAFNSIDYAEQAVLDAIVARWEADSY